MDVQEVHRISELHSAIKNNNLQMVNELLEKVVNIELMSESGLNALHLAVVSGNPVIVRLILNKGANVNTLTLKPITRSPLHLAVSSNNLEIAQILIKSDAKINKQDDLGDTTLHKAVNVGSIPITKLLLENGANPNIMSDPEKENVFREYYKESAFQKALKKRTNDMHHLFLNYGAGIDFSLQNGYGEHVLHLASEHSTVTVVKRLLRMKIDVNIRANNGSMPLHHAAKNWNRIEGLRIVKTLIKHGADIKICDKHHQSPFIFSIRQGHYEITKYLINLINLRNGIYVDDDPLYHAIDAKLRSYDIIDLILKKGFDIDNLKHGILAATVGDCRIMETLLRNGLDVNAADPVKELSIFTAAIYSNNWSMVQLMLDNGADINYEENGWLPLRRMWEDFYRCPIVHRLVKHVAMMIVRQQTVHEIHLELIQANEELKRRLDLYCLDLFKMKKTTVWYGLPSITYFDLLILRNNALEKCLRKEQVRLAFLSREYCGLFKEYLEELEINVHIGIHRLDIAVKCENTLHNIFGSILPFEITSQIVEYLDTANLEIVIQ